MADVQIQQQPEGRGSGSTWAWAIVVLLLIAVIAWFVIARGDGVADQGDRVDINVETPAPAPAEPPAGGTQPPPATP
jgi:hypothetical protein